MTSPGPGPLGSPGLKLTMGDIRRWAHDNVPDDMLVINADGEYLNDLDVWTPEDGEEGAPAFIMTFEPGP